MPSWVPPTPFCFAFRCLHTDRNTLMVKDLPVARPWRMGLLSVVLTLAGQATRNHAAEKAESFEPQERRLIDDNALWGPRERINRPRVEAVGSLAHWLVVHAAIPSEEELSRAEDDLRQAQEEWKPLDAPVAAQKIYDALIAELPTPMKLSRPHAGISVVENADRKACLVGLGNVMLDRDWTDSVLSDERTGRDQLAFVVARELSHVGLGHTRRRYQLQWLDQQIAKIVSEATVTSDSKGKTTDSHQFSARHNLKNR